MLSLISYIEIVILVCYTKHTSCKIAILIVYVDGIILTGSDATEMTRLKGVSCVKIWGKRSGYFLGLELLGRGKKCVS